MRIGSRTTSSNKLHIRMVCRGPRRTLESRRSPPRRTPSIQRYSRPWYNWLVRLKLWTDRDRLAAGLRAPAAILRDYRRLFGPDFATNADYARRIVCPALVIGGTADQLFDRGAS